MKIAIISDTHLGYGRKTIRENEAFVNSSNAMKKAVEEKADLILMPGDLFDQAVPSPETLLQGFQLFGIANKAKKSDVIVEVNGERKEFNGIPIIAIHGTHEFRGKDYANILSIFNESNSLIHVHANTAIISKNSEKFAIHCLGGVPEKKALDVLMQWNPQPVANAKNLFVFHQSIAEFLPTDDPMNVTLSLSDLPKNFDYYVDGHLHWNNVVAVHSGKFLLPGSTVITQLKKLEAIKPKGWFLLDTISGTETFVEISNQRRFFYEKIQFNNASIVEVERQVLKKIDECLKKNDAELIPLIKLKLIGSLLSGLNASDLDFNALLAEFQGKAIISIDRDFGLQSLKNRINELRSIQKDKASIASLGLNILEKKLTETNFNSAFDVKRVFELLSHNEVEKAMELLIEEGKKIKVEKEKETLKDFI
ncbi:MAG: DNA repair exonuclease [archaeon]|nr:DNA repair exonuclease [archaeon]